MAHIAKYKAPSVGHMLAHYRRDRSSLERDNIDPERIKNDLVVGHYTNKDGKLVVGRVEPREGEPNWGTVESRIERVNKAQKAAGKRATRKDADVTHLLRVCPHAVVEVIYVVAVPFCLLLIELDGEAPRFHCHITHLPWIPAPSYRRGHARPRTTRRRAGRRYRTPSPSTI